MPPEEFDHSDEEEDFSWDEYLTETGSEAAPDSWFCQNTESPPVNEFAVGKKLEAVDPRNTTSTCIATIIEMIGPRLRLRLDGTDDRNDFWAMVDSDLIHPYEYSAKHGRKIQPPLGFGNDLSKWPKFLERIVQTAGEDVFAAETCFKTPPTRPRSNEFKPGYKLEAVDPKNPHLICPATVKDVKRDKLLITFDGWSQSSQFWCSYLSRDLFPCGWCKMCGHTLQFPGALVDKKPLTSQTDLPAAEKPPKTSKPKSKPSAKTKCSEDKSPDSSNSLNETIDAVINNISETAPLQTAVQQQTAPPPPPKETGDVAEIDLSIVKQEIYDDEFNDEANASMNDEHNKSLSTNGDATKHPIKTANSKIKSSTNATVYIIPNANCGKRIKTTKFHSSHTKFGPGSPSGVYKSIVQSFIDCAIDRYELFKLIPDGHEGDYFRLKYGNINERKRLISVQSPAELWTQLKLLCQRLEIDDEKLFSKSRVMTNSENVERKQAADTAKLDTNSNENEPAVSSKNSQAKPLTDNNHREEVAQMAAASSNGQISLPLTPQPSSVASSSSSSSSSSSENNVANETTAVLKTIGQKRRSTAASTGTAQPRPVDQADEVGSEAETASHTASKLFKTDTLSTLPTSDWSIDQVVYYIYQLNDSNFSSYVEMFRHQEIDGKALLLLTTDILMKYMGFKLGPALKLNNYIDKLRKNLVNNLNSAYMQVTPKTECNN